jgi:hypothetical protein
VFHAPEIVVLGDDLIEGENNASNIVTLGKTARLADKSSAIKVEDKEVICFRVDKEIPRCNILVDNPQVKIQVIYHV